MSGPKRNADRINTIGIAVIGICACTLIYVTILALQSFYMKDTADIQTIADYGGNDTSARAARATATRNINEYAANRGKAEEPITSYRVPIDIAMKKVIEGAAKPEELIPGVPSTEASAEPIFGRSIPLKGAAPAAGSGSGSGSGSAAADVPAMPAMTPTAGEAQGGSAPLSGTNNTTPTGGSTPSSGANNPNATPPSTPKGNAP